MYHTTTVIPGRSDAPDVALSSGEPVIRLADLTILLPLRMPPAEQVEWLRDFAHRLTSLAEVIEAANVEQVPA